MLPANFEDAIFSSLEGKSDRLLGATKQHGVPCNEEQQRQTPRQDRLRVRSGLTLSVSVQNTKKLSIHQAFPVQTSDQLRFLG